ncbi:hypothetical protein E6A50_02270 [Brachyspira hampsonii]|uniref:hypothetical protein n=1 Tax=Brachyspira hampsonii TaxID=1287055 RepID=UPI000A8E56BA|nr:hypothetical protein [Brachyspira hampsonii]MBW5379876.1 hypothetical protein [Brachyspira hampsonii]MBW5409196.1 hypothetical protein [Brachyspira hampsonii]
MKKTYIFLFIIFMFIVSCANKITSPSEIIGDIKYYNPSIAETKTYNYYKNDGQTGEYLVYRDKFKKLAESKNAIIYVEESQIDKSITKEVILNFIKEYDSNVNKEIEIYGEIPDFDGNGKVIFLMADLNTNK